MVNTRSGRGRSISLPPPPSPGLANVVVSSNNSPALDADTPSGDEATQRQEPASCISAVGGMVDEGDSIVMKEEDVSADVPPGNDVEVQAPSNGDGEDTFPPSQGPVDDDGFEMPRRHVRKDMALTSTPSNVGTDNRFVWLRPLPENDESTDSDWSESLECDELPDLAMVRNIFLGPPRLPGIPSSTSFEKDLDDILRSHCANDVLNYRMQNMGEIHNTETSSSSDEDVGEPETESSPSKNRSKRRSINGKYKRPQRCRSHSPAVELNAVVKELPDSDDEGKDGTSSDGKSSGSSRDTGNSYLKKGKFKAFSEDISSLSVSDDAESLDGEMELAKMIQQHFDLQAKATKEAEKKAKRMAKKLRQNLKKMQMKNASSKNKPTEKPKPRDKTNSKRKASRGKDRSSARDTRSKSKTPLGLGAHAGRASSKLPRKSGLRHAMGDGGDGGSGSSSSSSPSSSLSLLSSSGTGSDSSSSSTDGTTKTAKQKRNRRNKDRKRQKKASSSSSSPSSSPSSSEDSIGSDSLFAKEPPSDHSSDNSHKHEKNR